MQPNASTRTTLLRWRRQRRRSHFSSSRRILSLLIIRALAIQWCDDLSQMQTKRKLKINVILFSFRRILTARETNRSCRFISKGPKILSTDVIVGHLRLSAQMFNEFYHCHYHIQLSLAFDSEFWSVLNFHAENKFDFGALEWTTLFSSFNFRFVFV